MKFGYTILYVRNPAASAAFYEAAFGLTIRFAHDSGQYVEMETGATALAFVSQELAQTNGTPFTTLPTNQSPAMEVAFVNDDVPAAFSRTIAAGAEPIAAPKQKPWGQTVSYVRDQDGFLVELCSPVGGG